MLYEMRIPPGVTESNMAEIITLYEVELTHTEYGPVIKGELEELEKARDHIVKSLNERLKQWEKNDKKPKSV
ncbi:MAG: hypothetical protein U1C19_04875 [Methanobacteriaceae archaeon]|jgi:hypothetical protein|nr:hypothetical protein [Methanobacteriaceae archaeon]